MVICDGRALESRVKFGDLRGNLKWRRHCPRLWKHTHLIGGCRWVVVVAGSEIVQFRPCTEVSRAGRAPGVPSECFFASCDAAYLGMGQRRTDPSSLAEAIWLPSGEIVMFQMPSRCPTRGGKACLESTSQTITSPGIWG